MGDTVGTVTNYVSAWLDSVIPQDVKMLEYNYQGTEYTYDNLISNLEASASAHGGINNRTLFIGDSMGGFLSAQLASKYGCFCILGVPVTDANDTCTMLFNTSYNPWRWYYQGSNYAIGSAAMFSTFDQYYEVPRTTLPVSNVAVVASSNDTLLDYTEIYNYWRNHCSSFLDIPSAGHGAWTTDTSTWSIYSGFVRSQYTRMLSLI